MKVALIQMNSQADKQANLAQAQKLMTDAIEAERPDLLVLPEVFTLLSENREIKLAAAETLPDGEAYRMLRDLAARHKVAIHGGSLLERDGDQLYNTTVAFDRDGRELARYRKIHLFDVVTPDGKAYRESATIGRGRDVVSYEFEGRRIGCAICYDLRFPELFQALARQNVDIIALPAAFTLQTGKDHWDVLLRARAIETETYVLASAQIGAYADGQRLNYGHSIAVDPWGHVIARASDQIGFTTARLDFDYLAQVRQRIPVAQHKVLV